MTQASGQDRIKGVERRVPLVITASWSRERRVSRPVRVALTRANLLSPRHTPHRSTDPRVLFPFYTRFIPALYTYGGRRFLALDFSLAPTRPPS